MDTMMNSKGRDELEEFLMELVLHVENPEDVDTFLEILKYLQDERVRRARESAIPAHPRVTDSSRYDIFKISPDEVARVAFVRGAENARKVVLEFHARGDGVYFSRQADAG